VLTKGVDHLTHVKQLAAPVGRVTRIALTQVNRRNAALPRLMPRRPQPVPDAANPAP
jgi:hypothetical protein